MKKFLYPTLTILFLIIGIFIGNGLAHKANAQQFPWGFRPQQSKVEQLLQYMQSAYVDEINMDSITDEVMADLVSKLDPHSSYIPKEDLQIVNDELGGSFSGIGVQFSIQNDTINIVSVISGGPSEGIGVLAGDKIIMVDDSLFVGKGINNEKVMHTLRGEKGTTVKLSVKRAGTKELLHYTITRGDIPVHSVDAKFMIADNIGFIRINKFAETTYSEFLQALAELRLQGAKSYIIDLRENTGGYMDPAIRMANEFLAKGDLIVYAEGRAYPRSEARANGAGRFKDVPLTVLIDEFSASASEIFAGAMQDNDRATIVGRRSFGKGLVQQQFDLADSSAVRLTVARYYIPSGRCVQKPYKMGEGEDYAKDIIERFEHGEFYSKDSIQFQDTTVYRTKQGRIVHGGGGVMPDVFVGRDTTNYTPYYNQCVNLALTYQFALYYTNEHRAELSEYTNWRTLEKHLLHANWLPEFVAFAEEKGVEPNPQQLAKSKHLLIRLVNAYIVRNILDDEGFFPLFERDDDITKRALQEMRKITAK